MLRDQEVWLQVTSMTDFHFADSNYETLMMLATAFKSEHGNEVISDMAGFMDFVQRPELMRILAALDEVPDALMTERAQVNDYIQVIVYKEPLSSRIKTLQRQIAEAKAVHNMALVTQLSAEMIGVLKEQQAQRREQ
jgi:DNA primase